jgi:hypothetical protein
MTREAYLALAAIHYEALEKLKEKDNFYDYEKGFDEIGHDSGRQYMEFQLNETSMTLDRRKKTLTRYGELSILKSNQYLAGRLNGTRQFEKHPVFPTVFPFCKNNYLCISI